MNKINNFNFDETLDDSERKSGGVFYTPEYVIDFMIDNLDIEDNSTILEPSSGIGRFTFKLIDEYDVTVDSVEIDDEACDIQHKTASNYDFNGEVNVINKDFFKFNPNTKYDYIIGNPPYLSSSNIPNRPEKREYIPEEYKFSKRCDLYVYFILKSIQHLKIGGQLTMIVPEKWMDTKYGQDLRDYMVNEVEINTIHTFTNNVFDADVKTSILTLTKTSTVDKSNEVEFIQLDNNED